MDFATSVIPGWHTTIFLLLLLQAVFFECYCYNMRKVSNLEVAYILQHIELMNIVIMITGSIVGVT
jgi:molybdopterin-containing oxidoreductase family membrane subunit